MLPIEAYKLLLSKVNKNDTNTNIKVPKSIFILLFNQEKRKWLSKFLEKEESSDIIENISELLILDKELNKVHQTDKRIDFSIPNDFFKRVSGYNIASKDKCNAVVVNWFQKPKDINVLLQNSHYTPSFEYQETLAVINDGKVSIYVDNFDIKNSYLTYYKEPKDLNIEGFKQLDGTPSYNQETGLSKENMEKIIDRVAVEITRNYESTEQLQLALQRQIENEQ